MNVTLAERADPAGLDELINALREQDFFDECLLDTIQSTQGDEKIILVRLAGKTVGAMFEFQFYSLDTVAWTISALKGTI